MYQIQSGTRCDVDAAAAFLEANGLSTDAIRTGDAGGPAALFAIASCQARVVGLARGGQAREDRGTGSAIPGRFHVNTVFVDPAHRGAGVGKGLVERLLADARETGFRTAQLWVHTANAPARSIYARFGFVPAGAAVDDERVGRIEPMCAALMPAGL